MRLPTRTAFVARANSTLPGGSTLAVGSSARIFGEYLGMETTMAVTTVEKMTTNVEEAGEILEQANKVRKAKDHIRTRRKRPSPMPKTLGPSSVVSSTAILG